MPSPEQTWSVGHSEKTPPRFSSGFLQLPGFMWKTRGDAAAGGGRDGATNAASRGAPWPVRPRDGLVREAGAVIWAGNAGSN